MEWTTVGSVGHVRKIGMREDLKVYHRRDAFEERRERA